MDPDLMTAAEFDAIYTEAVSGIDRDAEQWDREQDLLDTDSINREA